MSNQTRPIRVQRKRTKGYKMPENTISVCRPGKWGNPFRVVDGKGFFWIEMPNGSRPYGYERKPEAQQKVVELFGKMMMNPFSLTIGESTVQKFRYMRDRIQDLEGKNLGCFCPVGSHCHAEILLELANPVQRT